MNRRELVSAVAAQTGIDKKQVDQTLRGVTDVITSVVAKGEPVAISGFAKFAKVERAARMGRNPQTGEPVKIKASKKARITPLKAFKDSVMTPSKAPKLERGVWPPKATATKATATKATGTRSTAKAAGTRSTATKTAAKKTTGTRSTATKAAAKKTTGTRAAATKTTAKKTTTRKAPARKTTGS